MNNYWKEYYISHSNYNLTPSLFATWLHRWIADKHIKSIIDVGCGNGRDSYYFSNCDYDVTGVDNAVQPKSRGNETFINMDSLNDKFDMLYSRFSLHSIDEATENNLLYYVKENCKYIAIECRSSNDTLSVKNENYANTSYAEGHYRRYVELKVLKQKLVSLGFEILHASESDQYAPYKDTSPMCLRLIAKNSHFCDSQHVLRAYISPYYTYVIA